jgi:hypothetical protein
VPETSTKQLQAKAAAAKRWNRPDRDELSREYAAQRITDCIRKVLADAPPLTDEQRDRIAAILRGGAVG